MGVRWKGGCRGTGGRPGLLRARGRAGGKAGRWGKHMCSPWFQQAVCLLPRLACHVRSGPTLVPTLHRPLLPRLAAVCPFAHAGERARRRDPRTHAYAAIACLSMKQVCSRVDSGLWGECGAAQCAGATRQAARWEGRLRRRAGCAACCANTGQPRGSRCPSPLRLPAAPKGPATLPAAPAGGQVRPGRLLPLRALCLG